MTVQESRQIMINKRLYKVWKVNKCHVTTLTSSVFDEALDFVVGASSYNEQWFHSFMIFSDEVLYNWSLAKVQ